MGLVGRIAPARGARSRRRGATRVGASRPAGAAGRTSASVGRRWRRPARDAMARGAADLGRSPRTVQAYARSLVDYLGWCERAGVDVAGAGRGEIAGYLRDLRERPGRRGANVVALDSGAGLSNATLQLRLTVVRLFYDFLVEERVRERNPVARGYRAADGRAGRRGLLQRLDPLPWIPRTRSGGRSSGRRGGVAAQPADARACL